jgi:ribonucleoside-diphosphate reductase alpha chain
MSAQKLLDAIVESAWECGEPGLLFIDRINEANPTPALGPIQATNPCGEQPLLPWESCNLGSVNLARMVKNGKVDWLRLAEIVRLAVRFLDDVIEVNRFPMPQIRQVTLANRKIGLGVMGFADLLIELRIPYDSRAAVAMADRVMSFVQAEGKRESSRLATSRGSFPNFPQSTLACSWSRMRNATVTSIAPTGSISLIAGCSQSIEPIFSLIQTRRFLEGRERLLVHPAAAGSAEERDCETSAQNQPDQMLWTVEAHADYLRQAHDVSAEWQIRVLATFQKHVDNGISKTVNLPASTSKEDVAQTMLAAFKLRCKGMTVFLDNCRATQVVKAGNQIHRHILPVNIDSCPTCS